MASPRSEPESPMQTSKAASSFDAEAGLVAAFSRGLALDGEAGGGSVSRGGGGPGKGLAAAVPAAPPLLPGASEPPPPPTELLDLPQEMLALIAEMLPTARCAEQLGISQC